MSSVAPDLPNGFVVIVKRECATCQMVEPVLSHIASATNSLTVYTQDDPNFPSSVSPIHDEDLSVSWHYDIDTVPTLIKVVNGKEVERTFGWKLLTGNASPASPTSELNYPQCDLVVAP